MIKLAGDGVWAFHDCSCPLGLTNRYAHWARGPSNYYECGANFSRMQGLVAQRMRSNLLPCRHLDVQVFGKASSVWLLESNAVIWAVFVFMNNFSIHMQVSLFLWLSSRLASFLPLQDQTLCSPGLLVNIVNSISLCWKTIACIKEWLSTSAHTWRNSRYPQSFHSSTKVYHNFHTSFMALARNSE